MARIKLPPDVLEKAAFKTLPAKDKEEYLNNLLKQVLELNPKGITISQVKEALGLPISTVWHHLESLSDTAQCRKISRGNIDIYYPCGKASNLGEYAKDNVSYTLHTIENEEGRFVSIHVKRENRLGNSTICGGVAIPFELVNNIISTLSKVKKLKK